MRYLLAGSLLAASVALAFSGCATNDRCNDICNSRAIREYDKWVKAAAERDDAKIVAPSPSEQARILREARTVERIDPNFQEASKEAVRQTDAEFCAKATEEWQRKAFCHEKIIDGRVKR